MVTKTFLFTVAAMALLAGPVMAASTTSKTAGKSAGTTSISKSDEDFLSSMASSDFPGDDDMKIDSDGDGIADAGGSSIPDPFDPKNQGKKEPEVKTKYVYKPAAVTSLRRSIQDPRLGDDGYVQGLMGRGQ